MNPTTRRPISPENADEVIEDSDQPRVLSYGLIALGLLMATVVVGLTALAIYDADGLPLLGYIRSYVGDGRTLLDVVVGSHSVRIRATHTFGHVLSVVVYASTLLTLATISRALLAAGVRLLTPVVRA
jgi:hypothetical protein